MKILFFHRLASEKHPSELKVAKVAHAHTHTAKHVCQNSLNKHAQTHRSECTRLLLTNPLKSVSDKPQRSQPSYSIKLCQGFPGVCVCACVREGERFCYKCPPLPRCVQWRYKRILSRNLALPYQEVNMWMSRCQVVC